MIVFVGVLFGVKRVLGWKVDLSKWVSEYLIILFYGGVKENFNLWCLYLFCVNGVIVFGGMFFWNVEMWFWVRI